MQKQKIFIVLDEGVLTHVYSSMDADVEAIEFDQYADYPYEVIKNLKRKLDDVQNDPNMKDVF